MKAMLEMIKSGKMPTEAKPNKLKWKTSSFDSYLIYPFQHEKLNIYSRWKVWVTQDEECRTAQNMACSNIIRNT